MESLLTETPDNMKPSKLDGDKKAVGGKSIMRPMLAFSKCLAMEEHIQVGEDLSDCEARFQFQCQLRIVSELEN